MKTVMFLVSLMAVYAVAHGLGASSGWASVIAWAVVIPGAFIYSRRKGYAAALTIEEYRPLAEQLRRDDPDLYEQFLAHAPDSNPTVQSDPDAYVALFIAQLDKEGAFDAQG